ncbi:MAG: hypothetical protein EOO27_42875 [Comamonadaceae bacterium]|nr:MAG: hypothetical protein EOO27_42875 [Comamonadaceae bacterium]
MSRTRGIAEVLAACAAVWAMQGLPALAIFQAWRTAPGELRSVWDYWLLPGWFWALPVLAAGLWWAGTTQTASPGGKSLRVFVSYCGYAFAAGTALALQALTEGAPPTAALWGAGFSAVGWTGLSGAMFIGYGVPMLLIRHRPESRDVRHRVHDRDAAAEDKLTAKLCAPE